MPPKSNTKITRQNRQEAERIAEPRSHRFHMALRETVFLVLLICAFCALLALASFDSRDPGWSSVRTGVVDYHNLTGCLGAVFADVTLFLFGFAAYILPFVIAYLGYFFFRRRYEQEPFHWAVFFLKWSGFIVLLASGSALLGMHYHASAGLLPDAIRCTMGNAGGILGCEIAVEAHALLGTLGASLILTTLLLGGITFFTGISWFAVMDAIGHGVLRLISLIRHCLVALSDWARSRSARRERQATLIEKTAKASPRVAPRIARQVVKIETGEKDLHERQFEMFTPAAGSLPPFSILDDPPTQQVGYSEASLESMSRLVEIKLRDFGVEVQVVAVDPGPVITRFELQPAVGVKVNQISNLSKDLARALSCTSVRIVEVIPGKSVVGLEIPNVNRQTIALSEIIRSKQYESSSSALTIALGKDISGQPLSLIHI